MATRQPNDDKFKELILFICQRSEGDSPFGAIKLNKLLFFTDFLSYARSGRAVTWHEYRKLQNGPAPKRLRPLVDQLISEGRAVIVSRDYFNRTLKRLVAIKPADVSKFTSSDIALVTDLIQMFWGRDAASMSRIADRFVVQWNSLELLETIPYETALVRRGKRSEQAERIAKELGPLARKYLSSGSA